MRHIQDHSPLSINHFLKPTRLLHAGYPIQINFLVRKQTCYLLRDQSIRKSIILLTVHFMNYCTCLQTVFNYVFHWDCWACDYVLKTWSYYASLLVAYFV